MNKGISEELYDAGGTSSECLTLQALLNRYTKGTQMMRNEHAVVENSRELGVRQRERAAEFIMQLLLANNGHPMFRTQLSTTNMDAAREYILHGGDKQHDTSNLDEQV